MYSTLLNKLSRVSWPVLGHGPILLAACAALLIWPAHLAQARADSTHPSGPRATNQTTPKPRLHSKARHSSRRLASASGRRRGRARTVQARKKKSAFSRRLASLRPAPSRVQEIQRALIQAGELNGEPTGTWDEQTREAMQRYQKANGFPATGLPDAKSLMKMGLGPHPLPDDVQTPPGPSPSPSSW